MPAKLFRMRQGFHVSISYDDEAGKIDLFYCHKFAQNSGPRNKPEGAHTETTFWSGPEGKARQGRTTQGVVREIQPKPDDPHPDVGPLAQICMSLHIYAHTHAHMCIHLLGQRTLHLQLLLCQIINVLLQHTELSLVQRGQGPSVRHPVCVRGYVCASRIFMHLLSLWATKQTKVSQNGKAYI
eukprot:1159213-Pelagomonas_calceolata.AAC.4